MIVVFVKMLFENDGCIGFTYSSRQMYKINLQTIITLGVLQR